MIDTRPGSARVVDALYWMLGTTACAAVVFALNGLALVWSSWSAIRSTVADGQSGLGESLVSLVAGVVIAVLWGSADGRRRRCLVGCSVRWIFAVTAAPIVTFIASGDAGLDWVSTELPWWGLLAFWYLGGVLSGWFLGTLLPRETPRAGLAA